MRVLARMPGALAPWRIDRFLDTPHMTQVIDNNKDTMRRGALYRNAPSQCANAGVIGVWRLAVPVGTGLRARKESVRVYQAHPLAALKSGKRVNEGPSGRTKQKAPIVWGLSGTGQVGLELG